MQQVPTHQMSPFSPWRFCVAPMMEWTDKHCRRWHRHLSRHARLYTEMVTAKAILHGDQQRLLGFYDVEHPVALQLGGAEPQELAKAARIASTYGYDEVNLNVGCPSDRVQGGHFGACLMREPERVASCVAAMQDAVSIPVTVKCRIGVDDQEPAEVLPQFIETVSRAGCQVFIIHARKAWLQGLSPAQNRDVPPLDYALVTSMKAVFPHLTLVLNGGLSTLDMCQPYLASLDGVMMGRAAYHDPGLIRRLDSTLFSAPDNFASDDEALCAYIPILEAHVAQGGRLIDETRHMLGLFKGRKGARTYRRLMSEDARRNNSVEAAHQALKAIM